MKKGSRSLVIKGIMVLLSLLILGFAFTYSWYSMSLDHADSTGISTYVEASGDFEYAIGFSTSQTGYHYKHTEFTNEVNNDLNLEQLYASDDLNQENEINLLYDYTPVDITGDGVHLIRPAMNYGNWDINTASQNYSTAEANVQYISFDLILRSKVENCVVQLDSGSFAKGACETYSGDGNLTNAANNDSGESKNYNPLTDSTDPTSNKYGRFSRDAIVGAVRVAFLNYADDGTLDADKIISEEQTVFNQTPALLWIPRPDLYLDNGAETVAQKDKDKSTVGWELETGVDEPKTLISTAQINNSYSTYEHQYYNIFSNSQNPAITTYAAALPSAIDSTASGNKVTFGRKQDIVTLSYAKEELDENDEPVTYYYGKVHIRIWLEGTDSESRRALAGGKFSIGFNITA